MTVLRTLAALLIGVYGAVTLFMYVQQRSLQYHPENKGLTPEGVGLAGVSTERISTPDGETLNAWYAPAPPGRPTIIFFQGNGGEIGDRPGRMEHYQERGFGVLLVSYRGFGGSTGAISEQGLVTDAIAAYDWLRSKGVPGGRLVAVGESLGTGVAVQLAVNRPLAAVALEAPFTATVDIAADVYWWLPVRLLMKDQFLSRDHIASIGAPLLIQHGDADWLIPAAHGRKLFELAREPKQLIIIAGGNHGSILEPGVWDNEMAFFEKYVQ